MIIKFIKWLFCFSPKPELIIGIDNLFVYNLRIYRCGDHYYPIIDTESPKWTETNKYLLKEEKFK